MSNTFAKRSISNANVKLLHNGMHPTQNKKTPLKVLFIFYFIIFFSLKILFKTELSFSEFEKTMPTWFLAVPWFIYTFFVCLF